jgi:soluble lytic murein transglycosylase-like protein
MMLVMPAFAASPDRTATTVKADQKSGRLVRTVIPVASVPVNPVAAQAVAIEPRIPETSKPTVPVDQPSGLAALVSQIAAEMGVEESLVHSVIRAESNYNARAVSPKGAQGLMQLIPSTARRFGVTNVFDAKDNILGGVRYLKFLLDYYKNDYVKAIAAYNAGEGAVDRFHGIPPYAETQNYVTRVAQNLKMARQALVRAEEPAMVLVASANTETYQPIKTSVGADGRVYYRTP